MSTQAPITFKLSRKAASDLLKVSTRTLDRYIKSKKVASKNVAGRIMLNKEEIEGMKKVRPHKSIKKSSTKAKKGQGNIYDIKATESSAEERVYQKLYEEIKTETRVFQQRLEGANYRVGQLEAQVKSSVPMLEHQKILTGAKKDKYNKKVLYILLGGMLLLQPLWLLLAFF